jgi:hypothetical protein
LPFEFHKWGATSIEWFLLGWYEMLRSYTGGTADIAALIINIVGHDHWLAVRQFITSNKQNTWEMMTRKLIVILHTAIKRLSIAYP